MKGIEECSSLHSIYNNFEEYSNKICLNIKLYLLFMISIGSYVDNECKPIGNLFTRMSYRIVSSVTVSLHLVTVVG